MLTDLLDDSGEEQGHRKGLHDTKNLAEADIWKTERH